MSLGPLEIEVIEVKDDKVVCWVPLLDITRIRVSFARRSERTHQHSTKLQTMTKIWNRLKYIPFQLWCIAFPRRWCSTVHDGYFYDPQVWKDQHIPRRDDNIVCSHFIFTDPSNTIMIDTFVGGGLTANCKGTSELSSSQMT